MGESFRRREGEIIDGCLTEEEEPDFLHELIVARFIRAFGNWLAPRGGFVGGSEAKLAIRRNRLGHGVFGNPLLLP